MYLPVCLSGLWSRESLLFCVQAVWQTNTIDLCSGLLRDNSGKKIASGQYRGHRVSTLEALFSIDLSSLQFRSNLCSWATNSSTVLAFQCLQCHSHKTLAQAIFCRGGYRGRERLHWTSTHVYTVSMNVREQERLMKTWFKTPFCITVTIQNATAITQFKDVVGLATAAKG